MENIEQKLYQLLKTIAQRRNDKFSGIGIVVYTKRFSKKAYCDLRPGFKLEPIKIEDQIIVDELLKYSDYESTFHDGFCLMNEKGELTHISQYYVPPIKKNIYPNQKHGVRTYSAACGSTMRGVKCIGLISSNNDIYIYKDGDVLINDSNYLIK